MNVKHFMCASFTICFVLIIINDVGASTLVRSVNLYILILELISVPDYEPGLQKKRGGGDRVIRAFELKEAPVSMLNVF